jgi:hypothetical protein
MNMNKKTNINELSQSKHPNAKRIERWYAMADVIVKASEGMYLCGKRLYKYPRPGKVSVFRDIDEDDVSTELKRYCRLVLSANNILHDSKDINEVASHVAIKIPTLTSWEFNELRERKFKAICGNCSQDGE